MKSTGVVCPGARADARRPGYSAIEVSGPVVRVGIAATAVVIAAVVIRTVPSGVPIERRMVVHRDSPVPVAAPCVPSPGAAHQRAYRDSRAKANRARGD